jgi:transposase-like protein
MKLKPRKRYTSEFKAQAVELLATGKPLSDIAQELCISSNLLYRWRNDLQSAQGGSEGDRAVGESSEADDLRALRRENVLLRQENDILKKAAIILGTRVQPSSGK